MLMLINQLTSRPALCTAFSVLIRACADLAPYPGHGPVDALLLPLHRDHVTVAQLPGVPLPGTLMATMYEWCACHAVVTAAFADCD